MGKEKFNFFSEALIILILTAATYTLSYVYEVGYAKAIGIPLQFIQIGLSSMIYSGTGVIFMVVSSYFYWVMFLNMKIHWFIYTFFTVPFFLMIHFIVYSSAYNRSSLKEWISIISGPFIISLLVAICFVGIYCIKRVFKDVLNNPAIINNKYRQNLPILNYNYHQPIFITLLVFFVFLLFAESISSIRGEGAALRQEYFLVTNTVPEMVVLKIYGDNFLCSEFNRESKKLLNNFSYLKVSEKKALSFRYDAVGPLTRSSDINHSREIILRNPPTIPPN